MINLTLRTYLAALLFVVMPSAWADYSSHEKVGPFIERMVTEHKFERAQVEAWLRAAEKKQSIIDAISRPAEKRLEWEGYRKIFIKQKRIDQGVAFWRKHRATLRRAEQKFGVPAQVIVAIIGVETLYGGNMGSYRVIDSLATLGFDYEPRAKFFSKQLEEYLLMAREQGFDPLSLKGSYAGAMGFGQFIPSSYRAYAIDFDGDNVADILKNEVDAIGSVANYFARHGWQSGEPVLDRALLTPDADKSLANKQRKPYMTVKELAAKGFAPEQPHADSDRVTLIQLNGSEGEEWYFGYNNFYVITRYNHSRLYGMAVYQLSRFLSAGMSL